MDSEGQKNHGGRGDTETWSRGETASAIDPSLDSLIKRVIRAAIEVHCELGPGFQESTYHRALSIELGLRETPYESEVPVTLKYKGKSISEGRIDLLIDKRLVVELKAAEANPRSYSRQAVSYLKASGLRIGLVINFHVDVLKDGIARVITG